MLRRLRSLFRCASRPVRRTTVRLNLEWLEDRTAPAVFIVNTATDTAQGTDFFDGSLRYCLMQANQSSGNTILFQPGLGMITLSNGLPSIAQSMTIVGPGPNDLIVNNVEGFGNVFRINAGATVSLSGLTIFGGDAPTFGGGILNAGTLTVINCTIADNTAELSGGGIFNDEGVLTINDSTITDNTSMGFGGGIESDFGTLTVNNCTISNNTGAGGGGIRANGGTAAISNSTIANNTFGSGIDSINGCSLVLHDTIDAGNSVNGPNGGATESDFTGTVSDSLVIGSVTYSEGFNLIGDGTGSTGFTNGINGDQVGTSGSPVNAELGPLQDNGGPTPTMALLSGSTAINAGDPKLAGLPEFDQRGPGFARVVAGRLDIGAYESLFQPIPANMTPIAGGNQNCPVGLPYGARLQTLVTDSAGNPVANVPVTFTAPIGGASGTFDALATVPTNALGFATAPAFTANQVAGVFLVLAMIPGANNLVFRLTNTLLPTAITTAAGTPQQAMVGTAFNTPLQVKVTAAGKTPVSGITVVFAVSSSGPGATFTGPTAVLTNAQGVATAPQLTANTIAGTYAVFASVAGIAAPARFTLTNSPSNPAGLVAADGTPQNGTVGKPYPTALKAQLVDQYGNSVAAAGVKVTFTVSANVTNGAGATFPGKLTSAPAMTDSKGIATALTLTANASPGSFTVSATGTGLNPNAPPAIFILNNVAGPAADPLVSPPLSATVGQAYARPLSATVHDAFGNPVGGVPVTFSAPARGASGTFAGTTSVTAITASNGVAMAPAFTANTRAGTFVVTVHARGVSQPGLIHLTNIPAAPAHVVIVGPQVRSAAAGGAFSGPFEAKVTDAYGNVITGTPVVWAVVPNAITGARASFGDQTTTTVLTNVHGTATAPRLRADRPPGVFALTASVVGVSDESSFEVTVR
jgi:hypothetical protein